MATNLVEYNFLSGSSVVFKKIELFGLGKVFLGFARHDRPWGQDALLKIRFLKDKFLNYPHSVIAYQDDPDLDKKYQDLNSFRVLDNPDTAGRRIFIARIPKTETDLENIDKYQFIDEYELGQVYIDYIDRDWTLVRGLNPLFYFDDIENYDYYMFNYSKSLETRAKIEEVKYQSYNSLTLPAKLAYSMTSKYVPSTVVQDAGSLTRTINVLGESYIAGLNPNFQINEEIFKNAWFFVTTTDGVVIQDKMKFIEEIVDDDERYLVFEYITITGDTARLKVSTLQNKWNSLSVYNESLPIPYSSTPVADNNPPALRLAYLREPLISSSVFDVRGLSKIQSSEIKYCRHILDEKDEAELTAYGFDIETFTIQQDYPVEAKYAVTEDESLALDFDFDQIMIEKELPNTLPTEDIYRVLFLCYNPKDKDGNECTNDNYNESELFNIDKYGYDIGALMYIANKVPVYRKYIEDESGQPGVETFKIII